MTVNQLDNLNQMRMIAQASLEQKNIPTLINEALRNRTYLPDLNEAEQIIFKIRTELINYINESGIVHGFEWDGNDWPIQNGKIVITKDMIYDVVKKFEFLDADEVEALVNSMFDSQFVVRDENSGTCNFVGLICFVPFELSKCIYNGYPFIRKP